jgi:hypothetical protein
MKFTNVMTTLKLIEEFELDAESKAEVAPPELTAEEAGERLRFKLNQIGLGVEE